MRPIKKPASRANGKIRFTDSQRSRRSQTARRESTKGMLRRYLTAVAVDEVVRDAKIRAQLRDLHRQRRGSIRCLDNIAKQLVALDGGNRR